MTHQADEIRRMADRHADESAVAFNRGDDATHEFHRDTAAMLREYAEGVEGWRPMETAPRDGRPLLLLGNSNAPERCAWMHSLIFIGRATGGCMDWSFAAPVGMGGLPDEWFAGWQPLPALLPAATLPTQGGAT